MISLLHKVTKSLMPFKLLTVSQNRATHQLSWLQCELNRLFVIRPSRLIQMLKVPFGIAG